MTVNERDKDLELIFNVIIEFMLNLSQKAV